MQAQITLGLNIDDSLTIAVDTDPAAGISGLYVETTLDAKADPHSHANDTTRCDMNIDVHNERLYTGAEGSKPSVALKVSAGDSSVDVRVSAFLTIGGTASVPVTVTGKTGQEIHISL